MKAVGKNYVKMSIKKGLTDEKFKRRDPKACGRPQYSKIGFTKADDFEYLRASLIEQKEAGHTSGFEHKNLDERLQPKLSLEDAKQSYPSV